MTTVAFAGMLSLSGMALAQGMYTDQGIPSGYMPPPGSCRVWYDGVQPSQQPPVASCRDAERIVAGDHRGRVIYGGAPDIRNNRWEREGDYPYSNPSSVPMPGPAVITPTVAMYGFDRVSFENGYHDGYNQGRDDAKDRDTYDPARHGQYKGADHKYEREYGSKDRYKAVYRNGYLDGYAAGFGSVTGVVGRIVYVPR
jgi:hypothetical protein